MQQLQTNSTLQGSKYIIKKVLGQGGFGITYLAEHDLLGTKVAIKEFFMKDFCNRDETTSQVSVLTESGREQVSRFREKFLKEARNIAKLRHPNIVRISDVFEENGTAYYVMDFCEGGSLSELLKLHPNGIGEPLALKYIRQVASALEQVHAMKMNHLDIKPANILLDSQGNAVLIDFGLAKQYDVTTGNQTSTTPVGISHGYAPMEQYKQGGVSEFSPTTDIYSLGATLYKLITGQTPPEAQVLLEEELPVFAATPGVEAAIRKAMQVRRSDRPQSIKVWMNTLEESPASNVGNSVKDTPAPKQEVEDESTRIETSAWQEEEARRQQEFLAKKEREAKDVAQSKTNKSEYKNTPKGNSKKEKPLKWTSKMIKGYVVIMAILLVILIFCYTRGISFPVANLIWIGSLVGGIFAIIKERKDAGRKITITKKQSLYGLVSFGLMAVWIFTLLQKSNYDKALEYMDAGDDVSAIEFLKKAHAEGNSDAAGQLAWYYILGDKGIAEDLNKAFALSKESSDNGSAVGDFVNAYCYYWGYGTTADEAKAYDLFTKAAKKNQPDAQGWLSVLGKEKDFVWVDMGLSVKWATCNVGASNKYNGGDFYAWGEISVKQDYSRETYFDKNCTSFNNGAGWTSINPDSRYDVARTKLGGKWRMPTNAEFEELIANCEIEKHDNGILLISKINQSTLFFPTLGTMEGKELLGLGHQAGYWSSTLSEDYYGDNIYAQAWLIVDGGTLDLTYSQMRGLGFCVRPVLPK